MRRSRSGSQLGFVPSSELAYAPRSKAELAKLTDEELRELAPKVGVDPAGTRDRLIQRIEEQGVAHVSDKTVREPAGAGDDPDAQAIADSTLDTLPDNHPDKNSTIAPEVLRAPNQVDQAPTSDHRAPESHGKPAGASTGPEAAKGEMGPQEDASVSSGEADRGSPGTEPGTPSDADGDDEDEFSSMSREELEEAADEADIDSTEGGSLADGSMSVEELREALRKDKAEA